ncbi:hypothetical protein [Microbacterium sp. RG1]|uniref:hypothetical protein n=1 Tax=Microbacterium sp. RG1 TaxID=2489212 RepID=UPI0010CA4440|nr:hypothetical protein [Microbacterium sp. RG1]QCQ16645.1 hypothetical protein EHF32_07890 [Microbacterium sp. RG1]
MTTTLAPFIAATSRTTWNQADDGLYVAQRDGDFFGYIDRNDDGSFVAFDRFSSPVGRYATLAAAKASLTTVVSDPINRQRLRTRERLPFVAATWAGLAAVAVAVTAGVLAPGF